MTPFELQAVESMRLSNGDFVILGRCIETEICVGDVFTELRWEVYDHRPAPVYWVTISQDIEAEVTLRVEEISIFDRSMPSVPPGWSCGMRLSGEGLRLLADIDFEADFKSQKWWSLWGERLESQERGPGQGTCPRGSGLS